MDSVRSQWHHRLAPAAAELADLPAISPDGRMIAYVAKQGSEGPQLFLRALNSFEP